VVAVSTELNATATELFPQVEEEKYGALVGVAGIVVGTTAEDGADAALVPLPFVAVTVNV
jgi:hypothetical protein